MICMSDEEFLTYKNDKTKFPFYQEKLPNEIRILSMDVALVESSKNDCKLGFKLHSPLYAKVYNETPLIAKNS